MDAKAVVFYGYKFTIDKNNEVPENLDIITDSSGDSYIAVEDSVQNFDWDFGVQPLETEYISEDTPWDTYVKKFLNDNEYNYAEGDIGWFVLCDYS